MQAAVGATDGELAAAHGSLAVFAAGTPVPVAAVARLWAPRSGSRPRRTRAQLARLAADGLLEFGGETITIDGRQHELMLERVQDVRLLHRDLLAAYRALLAPGAGWWDLPLQEPYIWEHLVEHLRGAGDLAGMYAVATDLAHIALRCFRDGPSSAQADLHAVVRAHGPDPTVEWLIEFLSRSGQHFAGLATVEDVAATIALHFQQPPEPVTVDPLRRLTAAPLLTSRWGLPDAPGGTLGVGLEVLDPYGMGYMSPEGRTRDGEDVLAVALFPDGHVLATGEADGTVRLLNGGCGMQLVALQCGEGTSAVTFSPDGHLVATAGEDGTRLWDTSSHAQVGLLARDDEPSNSAAFAPDGRTLASAGARGTVLLWDVASGLPVAELEQSWLLRNGVRGVAYAPDGRTLACVPTDADGSVLLWDIAGHRRTRVLNGQKPGVVDRRRRWLGSVAFSPDGRALASADRDGTIRMWARRRHPTAGSSWDLAYARRRAKSTLYGHRGAALALAFAPDGRALASAGDDGILRLWDARDATLIYQARLGTPVSALAWSANRIALATGSSVVVLDLVGRRDRPNGLDEAESR